MKTPNLDVLKVEIAQLLASGVEPAKVEDVFIGSSAANQRLYERALAEYAAIPRMATEGKVSFRSGMLSAGGRRSVAGFREFVICGASS
jgi:hypothetical protein